MTPTHIFGRTTALGIAEFALENLRQERGRMRVLICGDRNWNDYDMIHAYISALRVRFGEELVVIHGASKGADSMAGEAAEDLGVKVEEYPADWSKYGKGAGPIRNMQMLKQGNLDAVTAFHNNISTSKGTKDMISISEHDGIPVLVMHSPRFR